MFVEVDEIKTGKTTRLVDNAYIQLLNPDMTGNICIVAYKMQISKYIKNLILDRIKSIPQINKSQYNIFSKKILVATNMIDPALKGRYIDRYYVDEFDYMDWGNVGMLANGYYTTSINLNKEKSFVLSDYFLDYIINKHTNIERKYKIEKVLADSDINFLEYLNKELKFNINI